MKSLLTFLISLTMGMTLRAGESQTQLLAQPILAHGGSDSWGAPDAGFKIVDVPFIDWHHQGHPAFQAIAQTNQLLTNAPRSIPPIESNLLAMYGITIGGFDANSRELWLRLDAAKAPAGWQTTVEDAAFAAMECIRIVADRYKSRPKLRISAPATDQAKWTTIAERFNKHDLARPFPRALPE